jgi:hypothetical protein
MSTPFANRPGAQASYAALMRPASTEEPSDADRTDARLSGIAKILADHENRLDALEAKDGEDEEGSSDGD